MNMFKNLSDDLATVVAQLSPYVVRVDGRRRYAATGIWMPDMGVVVTASHVVTRDSQLTVGLDSGKTVNAELVGRDRGTDLAVLRIDSHDEGEAGTWTQSTEMRVGNMALALGRPTRHVQATFGMISALDVGWQTSEMSRIDRYFRTDVMMYPGFSGGPLVSTDGRILGVNTSAIDSGASMTIPTETVQRVVRALVKDGKVTMGYLGVGMQDIWLDQSLADKVDQTTGLLITSVENDSPASRAELHQGDIAIQFGDKKLYHADDLLSALTSDLIGETTTMTIIRGGTVQEMHVTVGERV